MQLPTRDCYMKLRQSICSAAVSLFLEPTNKGKLMLMPVSPAAMMHSHLNIKRTPLMNDPQTGPVERPLREILSSISASEDLDQAHIIAGAINLYSESIRRLGRRQMLAAEDVFKIFQMVETLLGAGEMDQGLRQLVTKGRA